LRRQSFIEESNVALENWVVYEAVEGKQAGRRSVCKQSEWQDIETRFPGVNTIVRAGIVEESDAEKLARGTSGDAKKRG
jgi:hypothetical protein